MTRESASGDGPHILVVDDDRRIRGLLSRFLAGEGYLVSAVASAAEAAERLGVLVFDLIVLDVMMPDESGLRFAKRLREAAEPWNATPILMLTALSETANRVEGLEAGVDDYLGKPFEPRELALRIASILRRTRAGAGAGGGVETGLTRFADFCFESEKGVLRRGERLIHLTTRERDIMRILAPGGVVSRRTLALRGDSDASERSVDVEIARLRRKMEGAAHCLQTVRGQGYRLIAENAKLGATEHRASR
ncbi:response regulator transcription factor [Methylocystis heyeri]|uniref:Response regulator n=1 Tax=Methylocystis heyeri TaxID=391905 RepID=A0A6B8K9H3_9HYPH|nr:response regulator transcription factor [Methylocystis heyeri]QGM44934.1 response regulator [Methylocystis heyeri]